MYTMQFPSKLFYLKYPAQQPPQAPGGTYHHDTHENASPPHWITVSGCIILCGNTKNVPVPAAGGVPSR